MYDGIFFINNALKVNRLSVYSEQERYEQTLETIQSIDKYCPNNRKFIFDSSPEPSDYMKNVAQTGTTIFYSGAQKEIRRLSLAGARSIAESISFSIFIDWFRKQNFDPAKRIYKLSGRYRLNDNFILDSETYKDHFVFAKSHDSWMSDSRKTYAGVDKLYPLRLWHMDYNLLDTFSQELAYITIDCMNLGIDVEHSYYKYLHKYNCIELDKIGVCGNTAPDGAYIDE